MGDETETQDIVILSHRQRSYAGLWTPSPVKARSPHHSKLSQACWGLEARIWAKEWAKVRQTGYCGKPLLPGPAITTKTAKRYPPGETFHQTFSALFTLHSPLVFHLERVSSCFPGSRRNVGHIWKTHYL